MNDRPVWLPRLLLATLGGGLCLSAGAAWALAGPDIFVNTLMAGLAGCF